MALYVGHFFADFKKLQEEKLISINLQLFNQTDDNIFIEGIQGKLKINEFTTYQLNIGNELPLQAFPHSHDGCHVMFQQKFTSEESAKILEVLGAGKSVTFDFREVKLRMHKIGNPIELVTLYNFYGITFNRPGPNDILASKTLFL